VRRPTTNGHDRFHLLERIYEVGYPAGGVEAEAENRVRDDALEAGGAGTRGAAGGDPGAHAGLHHQERGRDARDADDQRRTERRLASPVEAPDGEQDGREGDADRIVGGPSDQALARYGR